GRQHVHQQCLGTDDPTQCLGIRFSPAWIGHDGGQVGLGAGHRWSPIHLLHRAALLGGGLGEQADPGGQQAGWLLSDQPAHGAAAMSASACRVAIALEQNTSAPAAASRVAEPARSCRSCRAPIRLITTGCRTSASTGNSSPTGSGCAPWPSTTSSSSTAVSGSAAATRNCWLRSDGSIIGCARPRVSSSEPKSIMLWPAAVSESGGSAQSGRNGMLDRIGPSSALAISIASSHNVPPKNSPRSQPVVACRGFSDGQCGQSG